MEFVCSHYDSILPLREWFLLHFRVELIAPTQSAALSRASYNSACNNWPILGAMLLDQTTEEVILLHISYKKLQRFRHDTDHLAGEDAGKCRNGHPPLWSRLPSWARPVTTWTLRHESRPNGEEWPKKMYLKLETFEISEQYANRPKTGWWQEQDRRDDARQFAVMLPKILGACMLWLIAWK